MSKYDLNQLITMWQKENITSEQTIGQLLLHLQALSERIGELEIRLEKIRQQISFSGKK